jgi:hypothetical protein
MQLRVYVFCIVAITAMLRAHAEQVTLKICTHDENYPIGPKSTVKVEYDKDKILQFAYHITSSSPRVVNRLNAVHLDMPYKTREAFVHIYKLPICRPDAFVNCEDQKSRGSFDDVVRINKDIPKTLEQVKFFASLMDSDNQLIAKFC